MIAHIKGQLVLKEPTHVIIDVNGVGYHIHISLNTFSAIKDEEACKLSTYFHVKEDIQALYGFSNETEKQIFMLLISVSGIGPSTALVMLSSLSADEIKNAIATEDVKTIQGVKGIGAKTAQRAILELKDKILKVEGGSEKPENIPVYKHNTVKQEALTALMTLGIAKSVAEKNVDAIMKKEGQDISVEKLIKSALKGA